MSRRRRKCGILVISLTVILVASLSIRAALAGPQNLYKEVLLLREAVNDPDSSERMQRAERILYRVYERYRELDRIAFRRESWVYWGDYGSFRNALPFKLWPKRFIGATDVVQVGSRRKVVVSTPQCDHLLTVYRDLDQQKAIEYQRPCNGQPERMIVYPTDLDDRSGYRLREELTGEQICHLSWSLRVWVGEHSRLNWKMDPEFARLTYIGRSQLLPGCSVLWRKREDIERDDYFFVSDDHLMSAWMIVDDLRDEPGTHRDFRVYIDRFFDYETGDVGERDVTPSDTVRKKADRIDRFEVDENDDGESSAVGKQSEINERSLP